jgi:hypothetical protein
VDGFGPLADNDPANDGVDTDGDGLCDAGDTDVDGDGVPDATDNCPLVANDQTDTDTDGLGDACDLCPNDPDNDLDEDGVCGDVDNCPAVANPDQADADSDGVGDACENCTVGGPTDPDSDGVCDPADNCPIDSNPLQLDRDGDGAGNECDLDADGDGQENGVDCSPLDPVFNDVPQAELQVSFPEAAGDRLIWTSRREARLYTLYSWDYSVASGYQRSESCQGLATAGSEASVPEIPQPNSFKGYLLTAVNACGEGSFGLDNTDEPRTVVGGCADPLQDTDVDGYPDVTDSCPVNADPLQSDADSDGVGDVCDGCPGLGVSDSDGDGACDEADNCLDISNPGQADADGDGFGDACDTCDGFGATDTDGDGTTSTETACAAMWTTARRFRMPARPTPTATESVTSATRLELESTNPADR